MIYFESSRSSQPFLFVNLINVSHRKQTDFKEQYKSVIDIWGNYFAFLFDLTNNQVDCILSNSFVWLKTCLQINYVTTKDFYLPSIGCISVAMSRWNFRSPFRSLVVLFHFPLFGWISRLCSTNWFESEIELRINLTELQEYV